MSPLIPALRDQELLYSAIARGGRYLQVPEAGPFMRELLGNRSAIAGVGLPGHLAKLAHGHRQHEREAAVDLLIDGATLFPFHTAFVPQEVRAEARSGMRGDVAGVYNKLGLATFKVRPPERLRFCRDCMGTMEVDRGDAWWRRDHQLPGIPLCPVHSSVLRLSDIAPGDRNRHSFLAASRAVCRSDAEPAIGDVRGKDLERLIELTKLATGLLNDPPAAMGHAERGDAYRSRVAEVGLMRSTHKVDLAALLVAFRDRWGGWPELIPGLELAGDAERSWLSAMVRTGRRAAHPLQHLMLTAMLDGLEAVMPDRPFGMGPWPCRNPVADHHGQETVADIGVRRDRGMIYGDFVCRCGYVYTRSRKPDGAIGEPKFRSFGPLFAPWLRRAVGRGEGLRGAARALGIDPKTLMREAVIAGVEVPWNLKPSGAVPPPTAPRVHEVACGRRDRRRARPKRNWFAIDTRLARSVRHAATAISAERPPIRVTFAAVERRIAKRGWVWKKRGKLPQATEALEAAIENTDDFRRRRLAWHVAESVAAGDLRPCGVLRAAGLPADWLPAVRDAIVMLQIRGKVAA